MKIEVGKIYVNYDKHKIEIFGIDEGINPYCYLGRNKELNVSNYYSISGSAASSVIPNLMEEYNELIQNNPEAVMPIKAPEENKLQLREATTYKDYDNVMVHIYELSLKGHPNGYPFKGTRKCHTHFYNINGRCSNGDAHFKLVEELSTVKKSEAVQHPSHYGGKDDPYETIKVMKAKLTPEEFIGAMKFNVAKYNDRAKKKGDELENYEKALFYQTELVNFLREYHTNQA